MIKRKNALVGLNYVNLLSDTLSLDTRLYYTYNSTRYEYNTTNHDQVYPTGGGAFAGLNAPMFPSLRVPGQFNETDDNRYGAGVKLDWRVSDAHRLLFGLDGNVVDTRTTQVAVEYPVPGVFNDIQEKNFAAFLQDEWKITDKLTALMSLRYDWSGINKDAVQNSGGTWTPINNKSVDAISPRVALNYKATDDMAFRASWGRSFRAPSLYERFVRQGGIFYINPNPDLNKETMTAWELGAYKQFSDKVSLDVSAFINDYNDLIESRPQDGTTYQYRNIPEARIWGIETSLNYRPSSDWNLSAGYTYMNAKNKSYVPGNAIVDANPDPEWLPYRPEHTASASVTWKATKKLTLNVNGRYVGKYKAVSLYTNPEGKWYPGNFVVFNAGLKYQFNKNITATLACNNINNTQYEEAEWFRAPGRTFIAGIDLTY
jgi:iron complex outermembrane receptor protein